MHSERSSCKHIFKLVINKILDNTRFSKGAFRFCWRICGVRISEEIWALETQKRKRKSYSSHLTRDPQSFQDIQHHPTSHLARAAHTTTVPPLSLRVILTYPRQSSHKYYMSLPYPKSAFQSNQSVFFVLRNFDIEYQFEVITNSQGPSWHG